VFDEVSIVVWFGLTDVVQAVEVEVLERVPESLVERIRTLFRL
jgi:hypothetical protein